MPEKTQTLAFKRRVAAPAAEVYRAFTNPTALRDWLANAAESDPRKGGRLYLWWERGYYAIGEYLSLEPGKKIAFTWHGKGEPELTRVRVTLAEQEGGTLVTIKHEGVGIGRKWVEAIREIEAGWSEGLENLQSMLETGFDLRFLRRPMLGVTGLEEVTADNAAHLGTTVTSGIWLFGTVEGMGAHTAGLQKGDVLVSLDGKPVGTWDALGRALQAHRAGDKIKAVYWRHDEKQTALIELSRRPAPEVPATPAALAMEARRLYAQVNGQLAELIAGVSEEEAARRPAPNEWSVKELLAHYVATERDLQGWIAELINGGNNAGEVVDSLEFRPNVTVRLVVLVGRYPRLKQLMQELERSEAETVAMLEKLPQDFVARKALYNRLAQWMTQIVPGHLDEHRDQFKATIEAARQKPPV